MKQLYRVDQSNKVVYVVADNLTQVVNQYPEARMVEFMCDTEKEGHIKLAIL